MTISNQRRPWFESDDGSSILKTVIAGPVAVVARLRLNRGTAAVREEIAAVLRLIRDATVQVGWSAPVVGIIEAQSDADIPAMRSWSRDQAWHFGDFLLEVPERGAVERTWTRWVLLSQGQFGQLVGQPLQRALNPEAELAKRLDTKQRGTDPQALQSLHVAVNKYLLGDGDAINAWVATWLGTSEPETLP